MTVQPSSKKLLTGSTGDWEVVIGMEVHAQVTSQAKLFSGASTAFRRCAQRHVSLVDAAMPGMLPVINEECVRAGDPHRPWTEGEDQSQIGLRPEELFLSRFAAGLSDQPVQIARGGRGHGDGRSRRTGKASPSVSSACISSRMPAKASTIVIRHIPSRSQSFGRRADGDRIEARSAVGR